MDSFLLHRDSYRPAVPPPSALARYAALPSYSHLFQPQHLLPRPSLPYRVDPWSSLPLPSRNLAPYSSYFTNSLDRPAFLLRSRLDGLGSFQMEPVYPRVYARPAYAVPTPRRHGDIGRIKSSPLASQSLRPRRKSFKQIGVGKTVDKTVQGRKKAVDVGSKQGVVKASTEALAEEARELHALWRTGVDQSPSNNSGNIVVEKRKSKPPTSEQGKAAKHDGKPRIGESKKAGRRRRKNLSRQQKKAVGMKLADGKSLESVANAEPAPETKEWLIASQPFRDVEGDSGWEGSIEKMKSDMPPMTDEETQKELSFDVQRQACNSVSEFLGDFSEGEDSESEVFSESDEEANGEQKPGARTVKGREESAFDFFSRLLEDNLELRKLYTERCNNGQFECLVCSGIGGKLVKRFGDLVSLVMHASKILKTKRRPEHRGYGRAVCGVLGWDALRTPTLSKGISNFRPRGCIPSADEATDMAIVKNNCGLKGIGQDGKNSVDVTEESLTHIDVSSDDEV